MSEPTLPGIDSPPRVFPDWYTPSKNSSHMQASRAMRGLHPTGDPLGPEDATCGDCVWLTSNKRSKRYYKCGLRPMTSSAATDIKLRWRACSRWSENGA